MSLLTLVVVAAVTVGSRVAALALLPVPRGAVAGLVERLPAPLFAALAALSLAGDGGLPPPAMLAAVGCALAVARWSSLLLTLAAGTVGFLAVGFLG